MNEKLQIIFGLLGGLAVFIYGMNMMSECLQKAAGEKMKSILALLTKNPVLGVIAGALTTAVLQSSSATTVMAIGFVSAGLMSLPQAISIIFGANIGTTMTAQIIAFKISDYIYIIIFIGFIISFIAKSEKVKSIGQTIFAFGLLFLGIETMGDVMKPLASSPVFTNLIERVAHIPVILLVKPGEDDRYIQRNADLYVWMPFAISSLKTEIAALIANREMIRKRYIRLALGGEASDPIDKEVESSEGDREFIRQVRSLIEERMTDSGFKIGELSDCMNMSRSSFYNKIKEITGHAPADYVRNVRLNRALVLLMSRKYTVGEVADMTGFSDPKYFGIVFKKYYGGSPTKYINNL